MICDKGPRGGCNLLVVLRSSNDFKAHSDKSTSFASLTRKANFRLSECRARWKAAAQGHPLGDRLLLLPLTRAARASSHWNHWRSLGNRVSKVKSTIWTHKQLYPRSLSVKGFSPHLQTISLIAFQTIRLIVAPFEGKPAESFSAKRER